MLKTYRWYNAVSESFFTNPEKDKLCKKMIIDEVWEKLILLQPIADKYGFGKEWATMCKGKMYSYVAEIENFLDNPYNNTIINAHIPSLWSLLGDITELYDDPASVGYWSMSCYRSISTMLHIVRDDVEYDDVEYEIWKTINPIKLLETLNRTSNPTKHYVEALKHFKPRPKT
jgi:hypothetical protein